MKAFIYWIAWIAAAIGGLFMLLGAISGVFLGRSIIPAVDHMSTYFHIANSFLLGGVFLLIYNFKGRDKTD